MTQFQTMYRGQLATVVGEVYVQVDILDADGKPTGTKRPENTGKVKLVYFDEGGGQQYVQGVNRAELTPVASVDAPPAALPAAPTA